MQEDVGPNTGVFTHEREEQSFCGSSYGEFWVFTVLIEPVFITSDDWYFLKPAAHEISGQNTGTGDLSQHAGAFSDLNSVKGPGNDDYRRRHCMRAGFDDRYLFKPVVLENIYENTGTGKLFDHDAADIARVDQHDGRRSL